ncbi:TetR/AcrR family transcriptional regulator [Saccharomonospora xinjiangensis]|uniref:TetR/AcrR family transcriptional regulator n=1 Tax=Saccharomonospora xinjiangensis TaxID=75294 RepID=UPI001FFD0129|nr:TetR/AcrR family transcriptional regulator [Saccharomonospora xinjiangensis]
MAHDAVNTGRTPLTPQAVVGAALSLAETTGLESVTIRRLARELGVTPMALYWHFRSKDELLDGMVGELYAQIESTVDISAPWPRQLRVLLDSVLDVLRRYPSAAPLFATRSTTSASSLRVTEALLDILKRGGFSPGDATQIARHALSTLAHLVEAVPRPGNPDLPEARRRMRLYLESLEPDRFPRLVEAAHPLSECEDPERHIRFGVDLLVGGVEAMSHTE